MFFHGNTWFLLKRRIIVFLIIWKKWWYSGVGMNLACSVEFGWDMYRKSGDKKFLDVLYNDLFRPLYWDNNGPQPSMGEQINALHFSCVWLKELNPQATIAHWKSCILNI